MKTKLLIGVLFFVGIINVYSQEYHPFLNGSAWSIQISDFGGTEVRTIMPGEEVAVDSNTYTKFFDTVFNTDVYIREDTAARKVYRIVEDYETLLYDFSLELGQTVTLNDGYEYTVESVSMVNVNGGQRKQLYLAHHLGQLTYFEIWLEGVGSTTLPLKPTYELFTDPSFSVRCSSQNGIQIYNRGLAYNGIPTTCDLPLSIDINNTKYQGVTFSPNPFNTELNLQNSEYLQNATIIIYNKLGQTIREIKDINGKDFTISRDNLQSGIYFLQIVDEDHLITKKIIVSD